MKQINRESQIPLYKQLIRDMRSDIENGRYKLGSRIPTEPELCESYGVSRITVRNAIHALTEEGILTRKQGKGTFVSAPYVSHKNLRQINSFHEACELAGKKPSSRVAQAGYAQASGRDIRELQLSGEGKLVRISRVRMADGLPVILENNRFSMAFSYLLESDLGGSLYNILRGYGTEPVYASHDISLVFAGADEARELDISLGDPLILLHEVVYDDKGRPIHNSDQYIRGDYFTLRI